MTCKDCRHLIVPPDKIGRRVVRKDKAYQCGLEPVLPPLPISMTGGGFRWPPSKQWVWRDSGEGCPCYAPREPEEAGE